MKTRLTFVLVVIGLTLLVVDMLRVDHRDSPVAPMGPALPASEATDGWVSEFEELFGKEPLPRVEDSVSEPVPLKTRGRVRLKPGQSAVVGFWQIQPDSSGMAIVTPEVKDDGLVQLAVHMLSLSDDVANEPALRELLPAPLDMEQYNALDAGRVERVMAAMSDRSGATLLSMPRVVTESGRRATLENRVVDRNGRALAGYRMELTPSSPNPDGSLSLDFGLEMP